MVNNNGNTYSLYLWTFLLVCLDLITTCFNSKEKKSPYKNLLFRWSYIKVVANLPKLKKYWNYKNTII